MASLTRFKQGQLLQFTGFPRGVPLLKSMFQEPTELNYYLQSTQPETARTSLLDKEFPKVSFSLLPETYHGGRRTDVYFLNITPFLIWIMGWLAVSVK